MSRPSHRDAQPDIVWSAMLAQHVSDAISRRHKDLLRAGATPPPGFLEAARHLAEEGMAGASVRLTWAHTVSMLDGPPRGADRVRTEPAPRELLTLREAADRMRISRSTLTRRIAAGDLTPVRHGGVVRLRCSDVDALGGAQ